MCVCLKEPTNKKKSSPISQTKPEEKEYEKMLFERLFDLHHLHFDPCESMNRKRGRRKEAGQN